MPIIKAKLAQDYRKAQEEICKLRAQVAQLHEAAINLGVLTNAPEVYPSCDGYDYPVQVILSHYRKLDWNAHIAKLQAKDKEKK